MYVPVDGASTQPVVTWAKALPFASADESPGAHDSASATQELSQDVVQQPSRPSWAHTAAAQALHDVGSASPDTCSLCEQVGGCTMPLRSSVGGAAGPSAVIESMA